jgi:hypothetical protein
MLATACSVTSFNVHQASWVIAVHSFLKKSNSKKTGGKGLQIMVAKHCATLRTWKRR